MGPAPVLRVDDENGVRLLTLDRPEARNAFNVDLYDAVRATLAEASADPGITTCVITGAGDTFSAGQDLKEASLARTRVELGEQGFIPFAKTLAAFDKPLIAAVTGAAVGVGLTMLLHCDLVLASETARFRAPFVSLGIVPEAASTVLLPSRIGSQAAAYMLLTGGWMNADEALARGLAWRLCAPQDLLPEAMAVAADIAKLPLAPLVATKQLLLAARLEVVNAAFEREVAELVRLLGLGGFA
jgi:enoyl-CoA hydratase/carnithine racemase